MIRMTTLLAFLATSEVFSSDYPQLRGPAGNGVVEQADVPTTSSDTKNLAWTVKLPGTGWSQPVVVAKRQVVFAVQK